jgi:hypothetical protein
MKRLILTITLLSAVVVFGGHEAIGSPKTGTDYGASIFRIYYLVGDEVIGGGSAFLCDKGLVTAAHCCALEEFSAMGIEAEMWLYDCYGRGRKVKAYSTETDFDIGYLVLEEAMPPEWKELETEVMVPKQWSQITVVGCYGRAGFSAKEGGLLSMGLGWATEYFAEERILLHSACFYKGFSGSPCFNAAGKVIGVNCFVTQMRGWHESGSTLWEQPEPEDDCPGGT